MSKADVGVYCCTGGLIAGFILALWMCASYLPPYDKIITAQVCQPRCQAGEVAKMELKENKILCFCSQTTER